MKRLIPAFLAVISLLLVVAADVGGRAVPALAETTSPLYGCGGPPFETDYNNDPIGGGLGYNTMYTANGADYVVSSAAQLKSALASATSGERVHVADGTTITLSTSTDMYSSGVGFNVPAGVMLTGGRGVSGINPGNIRLASGLFNESEYALVRLNTGSRVCGLHIDGPQDGTTGGNKWRAIKAIGDNAEVSNCEIHGLGHRAVVVEFCTGVWIHHNYIHHIQQSDAAMIVVQGSKFSADEHASATVEGNYFDYGTQCVAGARGLTSYVARYNYIGATWVGKIFDCHGQNDDPDGAYLVKTAGGEYEWPAGEYINIYNNTSESPDGGFVRIRGIPTSYGFHSVHNNWTYQAQMTLAGSDNGPIAPIAETAYYLPEYQYNAPRDSASEPWGYHPWIRMEEYDNWWGTTPPSSSNRAPVLDSIGNKAVVALGTLAFTISATDRDGDALTYSASNLPAGAAFDPSTRTFLWTPEDGQVGVYAGIRFEVSDGSLSDTEDIAVTVTDGVQADVNGDGAVNSLDMIRVGQHWNEAGESGWIPEDINKDGTVNVLDATLVGQNWTG